jgi:NAD(P)H-hydrate repair Nnr-like enzyme with NAD(P)H-hydrate dehydratase domain
MEMHPYWRKQTSETPLYPDIEWNRPEQRSRAGKLGIVGGNKLGFAGVAESYSTALNAGVGEVRVLLPDVLRKTIPTTITDTVFGASNPSGSLAREAAGDLHALGQWANGILMIGDAGRNSETAILYEEFLLDYTGPLTITRDAIDLVKNNASALVERPSTLLVASFAQVQKLFQAVYYPKILTFSMQLTQLVEALHKFTITYPVNIAVLHKDYLLVAHDGNITTTQWQNAMAIWRGSVATQAACYWLWNPTQPLEAVTASIVTK